MAFQEVSSKAKASWVRRAGWVVRRAERATRAALRIPTQFVRHSAVHTASVYWVRWVSSHRFIQTWPRWGSQISTSSMKQPHFLHSSGSYPKLASPALPAGTGYALAPGEGLEKSSPRLQVKERHLEAEGFEGCTGDSSPFGFDPSAQLRTGSCEHRDQRGGRVACLWGGYVAPGER